MCGWAFVALLAVGNLLPGLPPGPGASANEISQYFAVHRAIFLCAVFLEGLSVWPYLIFVVALASALTEEDPDPLRGQLMAFAGVAGAVALAVAGFWATLAFEAPSGYGPEVTRAVFALGNLGYNFIGFPFAAFVALASLRMRKTLWSPRWIAWLGFLASAGQLITAAAFARDGIFSPGGSSFIAAFALFALWIVLTSFRLWRWNLERPINAAS